MSWTDLLPEGATAQAGGDVDTDELAGLARVVEMEYEGEARRTAADLEHDLSAPGFDPSEDIMRVWNADGLLVAAGIAHYREPWVSSFTEIHVLPDTERGPLIRVIEAWARELGASRIDKAPEGAQVGMAVGAHGDDREVADIITSLGYKQERFFLEMVRTFDGPVETVPFPDGLTIRTIGADEDVDRMAEAIADAFRDHFGYTEQPIESRIERWRHWRTQDDWDDDLVWFAEDGDEIAGVNVCLGQFGSNPDQGYVATLGVRRRWRGQGLARAMLLESFAAYQHRGMGSVSLHVDADSLTGATKLYESVGMVETNRYVDFERILRPGEDLMVR